MKIFYWSPFISKVATVLSVVKSAESILKYSKKKEEINVALIDAIGEWKNYESKINPKIEIIKLNEINFLKYLPKGGFIKSRISYLFIFIFNFFKLRNLLNKKKPEYLIVHLMTSLPIFLSIMLKNKTNIILRLSGLPKLNIIRYLFWKLFSKKIYKVTCPTVATYKYLLQKNIFDKNKLSVLRDPAIILNEYSKKKFDRIEQSQFYKKKFIIGIGRLTKQKNFALLILAFEKILKIYPDYILLILGDGEQKMKLIELINRLKIQDKVFLLGFQNNVYKYLLKADCFILSSLWEDPGFVLLEAGLSNTCVISSNCINGPQEILSNGKNGFLFENNNLNDLLRKFDEFKKQDVSELNTKKKYLKKEIKKFTQFAHFNSLKKIINLVD
jgi:glycosyltransferase involved in cell wall biosynthesis